MSDRPRFFEDLAGVAGGAISALAWSDDGTTLALGSETGFAALVDFSKG